MTKPLSTLLVEVEEVRRYGHGRISILLWSDLSGGVAVLGRDRYCHRRSRLLKQYGKLGRNDETTLLKVDRVKRGRRSEHRGELRERGIEEPDDSGQRGRGHWSSKQAGRWLPDEYRDPS